MPLLPNLNSLGKLCGSSRSTGVMPDKPARRSSVKRMSIIEDGDLAEVLYLIPKQSMLRQLPNLNPNDYYLCERLMDVAIDPRLMAHAQDTHHPAEKPVIDCHKCGEPCKGEVLRVQSKHFHIKCFTCKVCGCDLAQGGFFMKNGDYLCTLDYQHLHGTRCNGCGDFVEGEVVTALGKTYHPTCFVCTICKRPFPAGDRVTFNGKDCLCQRCVQPMSPSPKDISSSSNCAGCGRDIKNGQALLALERQWHLGCFKCKACGKVLTGEYISKDDAPYCEKDFQIHFGVKCEACHQFITGKVLEAGDKHYHPSCARCSRCNQMFTEGEEMYLQGSTVWHPDCKNSSRAEEKQRLLPPSIMSINKTERQPTRSSSESISSRPGSSIPGSPGHTIYAKVDNEILDYKDLAAIPKVKAIYDIERPDLITYEPFYSITEESQERQSLGEPQAPKCDRSPMPEERPQSPSSDSSPRCSETSPRTLSPSPSAEGYHDMRERMIHRSTSQGSISSPIYSRHNYTPTLPRSPQHFHRPELLSSPAVQRLPYLHTSSFSSSHNDSRPTSPFRHHFIPHNKASFFIDQGINIYRKPPIYKQHGHDTRRRSREEEEEEMQKRRQIQEEHLSKMQSGLGKLILKEEMEKEMTQERYSRSISAQRYDSPQTDSCKSDQKASMTSSLPGYGRNGLHRPQSTDFSQYNSYGDVCGGLKEFQVCNE
ncbi:actin-binding LIM protein 1-like isoform X22 [Acipenser ruthenus]|uniref:actin-binding LIM protein 1-like isoform X22 n=1 Tax=Acipenser ruthenus TaxID=7906 RepID=UPI00274274A9|nr:actin-binding LIM protein 1-like isoform X22 [Acipenser ruthenus]